MMFPVEVGQSSANAEVRPNHSAECSARQHVTIRPKFGRTSAKIRRHFAVRLWRFALAADVNFKSLLTISFYDHGSVPPTFGTCYCSSQEHYSNAGSVGLLLVWPSVLELSANWTSTPRLDTRRLQAEAEESFVYVDVWLWCLCKAFVIYVSRNVCLLTYLLTS